MWEAGGRDRNHGRAVIIAGPQGEPLTPVYVKRVGRLSNRNHALFRVKEGYFIIEAYKHGEDYLISVYKVKEISTNVYMQKIAELTKEGWDNPPPEFLRNAIEAAMTKASIYHCKKPIYVKRKME